MSLILAKSDKIDRAAVLNRGREVVHLEANALGVLADTLDDKFVTACEFIAESGRRIVLTGMGKSGLIARKIAATFSATGTPALYIHPGEAAHGDLGMMAAGDVLVVLSNSGNTAELRAVLEYARRTAIRIVGMVSAQASLVDEFADVVLRLPLIREACGANVAPTTSTTLQLALGDALAMAVMDMRGVSQAQLRALHPAGAIGLRLSPISELMHSGKSMPLVRADTGMPDAISVITSHRFGVAGVVDDNGELIGVITDGDLRRHFDTLQGSVAAEVMTSAFKSIASDTLATDALIYLNEAKITAAFIVNRHDSRHPARPIGVIHIHDLLQVGLG
jgi:arabinose-5-phosphate isomerase